MSDPGLLSTVGAGAAELISLSVPADRDESSSLPHEEDEIMQSSLRLFHFRSPATAACPTVAGTHP